ncbi:MAG TPA: hypothetical protein VLT10_00190 [Verrucomicrobiae bacterium]|nr:hypothetical protein [Verrucomicrobiae bacterium]
MKECAICGQQRDTIKGICGECKGKGRTISKAKEFDIGSDLEAVIHIDYSTPKERKVKMFFSKEKKEAIFSREYIEKTMGNILHLKIEPTTRRSATLISGGNYDFNDSFDPGYSCTVSFKNTDDNLRNLASQVLRKNGFGVLPTAKLTMHSHLNEKYPTHSRAEELLSIITNEIRNIIDVKK